MRMDINYKPLKEGAETFLKFKNFLLSETHALMVRLILGISGKEWTFFAFIKFLIYIDFLRCFIFHFVPII
jgi:hypothetical protein